MKRLTVVVEQSLWKKFEFLQHLSCDDLQEVSKRVDTEQVWKDCLSFFCRKQHEYISRENLIHLKDDSHTLVNMFRLY